MYDTILLLLSLIAASLSFGGIAKDSLISMLLGQLLGAFVVIAIVLKFV